MELGALRGKGRYLVLVAAVGGIGYWYLTRDAAPTGTVRSEVAEQAEPVRRVVPRGVRIRVEVLNGTGQRGLARRGTTAMRDAGFDVVATGNHDQRADSSIVIVRTGNEEWGRLAVRALGAARLETRPDSSRHVDLTIVLGTLWRPPPQPLDP